MKYPIILLMFALMSCASLTKEDCTKTNWVSKGELDATNGNSISRFTKYQQECKRFGISISKKNYIEGHHKGLEKFCTYKSGHARGEEGSDPFAECDKISHNFNKGYKEGFEEFLRITKKKKLEEEQESERKKAIESILSSYNSEKCTFDSDCRQDGDCRFNKCRHDNSECTFNSDCKIEGDCSNESKYVSSLNESVSVNVCKY